jgi:hypothetical protein
MKKIVVSILILLGLYTAWTQPKAVLSESSATQKQTTVDIDQTDQIMAAYRAKQSDIQVLSQGSVVKLLKDDDQGSRHQKFILKLNTGHTLLVAHNIDLSSRISELKVGDTVRFYGEYEWRPEGGVIHWTHRDPQKRHIDGWLEHQHIRYE